MKRIFLHAVFILSSTLICGAPKSRVAIADGKISLELPDGWKKSELNPETTVGGFASSDNTTSVFFREFEAGSGNSMQDILSATIANFEEQFEIEQEGEAKTGTVQGPGEKRWPAIFSTLNVVMEAKPHPFSLKFYLMVFDLGDRLVFVQASTTRPLWDVRERQILELIRSIVATE